MRDVETTPSDHELKVENVDDDAGNATKLIGSYVRVEASASTSGANPRGGFLIGKVSAFDASTGLFSAFFEDGQVRSFERLQLSQILLGEDSGNGLKVSVRKRKLDHLLSTTPASELEIQPPQTGANSVKTEADVSDAGVTGDCDSVSLEDVESCKDGSVDVSEEASSPEIQIIELPPSTGDIGVPEGSVSYLFSVYNFLRSFSIQLFLSPFSIDDFVGSLKCNSRNSLLDAVHVALLRALRIHLQTLSSEGSVLASRCLRYQDWSLLDHFTWPVFLVEYLFLMGYMKGLGQKNFEIVLSGSDYYKLSAALKLEVLQILCDDIISSAELREELEMRENMEEEACNVDASFISDIGSKRVQTRSSKSASSQNIGNVLDSSQSNKFGSNSGAAGAGSEVASSATDDSNSDECRLCGMDGTLVCCDGCPSAYHSRCIGLNKASLPSGLWFCPECTVDKLGLTCSRIGRGIKGAEVFGIDPCGRMFLGTCNYLLVIGTMMNAEPFARYYNENDALKVVNNILSASEDGSLYVDICEGALRYWNCSLLSTVKNDAAPVDKEHLKLDLSKNVLIESRVNNTAVISVEYGDRINCSLPDSPGHSIFPNPKNCDKTNEKKPIDEKKTGALESLPSLNYNQFVSNNLAIHKVLPVVNMSSNQQLDNVSSRTAGLHSNLSTSGKSSAVLDTASCVSTNDHGISKVNTSSSCLSFRSSSTATSDGAKPANLISVQQRTKTSSKPAIFKLQGYVNLYIQGDIAASAAAKFAVLTTEENKPSEMRASTNPKKIVSANTTLQMKAFSEVAVPFPWPSFEKKVMEVPRERCGWCIACKGSVTNRRGCFLNLAAANAVKGTTNVAKGPATAVKVSSKSSNGSRPIKHDDTEFSLIAAHITNMEDSLHGLISGPLLDTYCIQQWRKELKEASSCGALKRALLELERNLRRIAFTGSWYKLADDATVALSAGAVGASCSGSAQKRGPGRRAKKASVAECTAATSDDNQKDVQWRREGKFQKFVCHPRSVPSKLIKKAARQGGSKRMPGLCYVESRDLPSRSRQLAWQASVETSKNASQLALQVRYLDAHIRWKDLLRPEQNSIDNKTSDIDSSTFRNAVICGKKVVENNIIYALMFSNQKHLPLRITKNILESETINGENVKLWFSENHVPLYLIKEYEEKSFKASLQSTTSSLPIKLGRKLLKDQRSDIFSYLVFRRDGLSILTCPSCKQDVLLRDSATCGICQGSCHKDCTLPLIDRKRANLSYTVTCKICYHAKTTALNANRKEIVNVQLPTKKKDDMLQLAAPKPATKMKVDPDANYLASKLENKSKGRHYGTFLTNGLVWKQKNDSETGESFRFRHLILKNTGGLNTWARPTCCLCRQPYRSDLMYLRCEKCLNWYHADALNVEEHQIFNLVGFKCCKRNRSSLQCPFVDPNYKKTLPESIKDTSLIAEMSQPATFVHPYESINSAEVPSLNSFELAEQFPEQMEEFDFELDGYDELIPQNQQNLCATRAHQIKHESDLDTSFATPGLNVGCTDQYTNQTLETNDIHGAEWELPGNKGFNNTDDNTDFCYQWHDQENGNFDNMEYEPQTYFSFTELLASGDGQVDPSDGLNEATDNGLPDISFDESRISFEDVPSDPFGSETFYYEVACSKCKINQPSPDLKCEICGLLVHSHCSPWVESEETFSCTSWRCGNCRDWR